MPYVLLVDDDDAIRECLSELLRGDGYVVRVAEHGRRALEIIDQEGSPCLALVDLMMPVMNGVELIERLRENPRYAAIPIVVFSGGSSLAPPSGTLFLRKPLGSDRIRHEVEQHCRLAGGTRPPCPGAQ